MMFSFGFRSGYRQHTRCYDNMGIRDVSSKKISSCYSFAREKKERIECSKKKRNLGIVFFMVASDRRCFMFCWRMVEAPFITRLFSHFIR
jgi:hypothetical protein